MKKTLLLNSNWDIDIDGSGNFKLADDNRAIAQNSACAVRAFTQDMYFNQADGIPHFYTDISNHANINTALLAHYVEQEAGKFAEVKKATIENLTVKDRVLQGFLKLTLNTDEVLNVSI